MPEWAREQRKRAGDREPAEQNDCCAVKLICMIKGSLIATLSCGVLIIRYRIIKGRASALLWLDWYTLDFLGGTGLELFAATTPSAKPSSCRMPHTHTHTHLHFHLNANMYFCFLFIFCHMGGIEWTEGGRGRRKILYFPPALLSFHFPFFSGSFHLSLLHFYFSLVLLTLFLSFLHHKNVTFRSTMACHWGRTLKRTSLYLIYP